MSESKVDIVWITHFVREQIAAGRTLQQALAIGDDLMNVCGYARADREWAIEYIRSREA